MLKPKKLKKSAVNTTARRQDKNRYFDDQPGSKTDNLKFMRAVKGIFNTHCTLGTW